ncbi:hypothetical protein C2E23DRAFT_281737 [Lenzites betulinus]|nr:hypothetical protein C2E23DRAFT_281737 [Lenzites betulinus]
MNAGDAYPRRTQHTHARASVHCAPAERRAQDVAARRSWTADRVGHVGGRAAHWGDEARTILGARERRLGFGAGRWRIELLRTCEAQQQLGQSEVLLHKTKRKAHSLLTIASELTLGVQVEQVRLN